MSTHSKITLVLLLSALTTCLVSLANGTPTVGAEPEYLRRDFVAAMQRIQLQQPDAPDSRALQAFVIYDYLVAARLRRDLLRSPSDALDTTIDAFLQAHWGQPVARGLRRDWLGSLAERHRWDLFLARSLDVTDPGLVCDRLTGRLSTGDTAGLGAAALARWSLPQRQPAECNGIFAWLRTQGLLTPALAEARARAALAVDNSRLARESAADVTPARAAALLQWSDLLEGPRVALAVLATHPALAVEPEALIAGFEKLAHMDSLAATNLLPQLLARPDMTPALQSRLQRTAALGAAYDRDPRSVAAFDRMDIDASDTLAQEWRVRAALWQGDYVKARAWIEAMAPNLAALPRWRYWRARAVEATSNSEAAAPLYAEIAELRDYYGYLAADRLRREYRLNARPSPDDTPMQNALASEPGVIRAHELFMCDMTDDAGVEWAAVFSGAAPALKIQAAHLAARWGWHAQVIASLAQAGEWDDVRLRYPRPYPEEVAEASKLTDISPDWILSVMRQESLFRKDAVSRADARGVMQMLPATAVAVARRWHLPVPLKNTLFDPAAAIALGAAYLHELLERQYGHLALALAAYNAGPAPVARWLPAKAMDADIWIENIPYTETRSYVQHILEHMVAFAWVRNAEPPRLDALLPAVRPAI
ncbi:MAG: lytic transglycosylase domain-containing protein [Pseudomonadota bacterium]|nr:lytic transglycosylase domain-containing protein [Pseudomonadota bacterium]